MAISINRVTLLGRLGRDPERRGGARGPVTFSLATSESWKDRDSGERKERTQWTNVVVWAEQAQKFLLDYVKKGDQVYIEGQLETSEYDKDGEKRYSTEVVVRPFSGSVQSQSKERREQSDSREPDDNYSGKGDRGPGGYRSGSDFSRSSRDIDDEIPF